MSNPFSRFAFASPASGASSARATGSYTEESINAKREWSPAATRSPRKLKRERSASPPPPLSPRVEPQLEVHGKKLRSTNGDAVEAQAKQHDGGEEDRRVSLLRELLRAREAMETPIDRFGTQACVFAAAGARARRFQLLAAALLSAQTRDEVTFAAMQRLHAHGNEAARESADKQGLTVSSVLATSESALSELLKPVGFYRRKARQLRRVAASLRAALGDDVPQSVDELEALPGVGPKVARVVLLLAWGRVDGGIIVDTHVHRLAQRFGWTPSRQATQKATPEDTRRELEAWVPREHWAGLSLAVVGFGQTVCAAVGPKCAACPIAHVCPSAFKVGRGAK